MLQGRFLLIPMLERAGVRGFLLRDFMEYDKMISHQNRCNSSVV